MQLYHFTLHYVTLHHITFHCITLHHNTLHCNTLHYIRLHCVASHYTTSHYIASQYIILQYTASDQYTINCSLSPYATPLYNSHYNTHYIILQNITLHHITSHNFTLHYITLVVCVACPSPFVVCGCVLCSPPPCLMGWLVYACVCVFTPLLSCRACGKESLGNVT